MNPLFIFPPMRPCPNSYLLSYVITVIVISISPVPLHVSRSANQSLPFAHGAWSRTFRCQLCIISSLSPTVSYCSSNESASLPRPQRGNFHSSGPFSLKTKRHLFRPLKTTRRERLEFLGRSQDLETGQDYDARDCCS